MDKIVVHRLGYFDLFVASMFAGVCLFLSLLLYQRAKEHPLNSELRRAQKIDKYIHKQLATNLYREDLDSLPPVMGEGNDLYSVERCGSVMEGYGFFAIEITGTEQDIDVMVSPNLLRVQEKDIDDRHTPVGFVWVRLNNLLLRVDTSGSELSAVLRKGNPNFVSAHAIYHHFLRTAMSRIVNFNIVQNEPAITLKAEDGRQYGYLRVIDLAVSLQVSSWPTVAAEWLNRESRNSLLLSVGTIQKIARAGCHLVYKPSGLSTDPELDWRFSFSKAERTLFQYHSDKLALKLCYIMLRYAYKKHLKPRLNDKKILPSYFMKTTFLWLAETETEFDYYNVKDHRLGALFLYMVEKLKERYEKHVLFHYFIRHWNLLRGFSNEEVKQVVGLLEDLLQNPKYYICTYIEDLRRVVIPQAAQNGEIYKELLVIIDESYTKQLLVQVLVVTSCMFATLVFVKCALNLLSLDIALCSLS